MLRLIAGCTCLIAFVASQQVFAQNSPNISVFSSKKQAVEFTKKEHIAGGRTNITTQVQSKQRYIVYLKGYRQWSVAFKQAQALERMGYKNIEVVKGQFERDYSIIIAQLLSKEKAGKVFNKLRGLGLRNAKVKTDSIKLTRYIVTLHPPQVTPLPEPIPEKIEAIDEPISKPTSKPELAQQEKIQPVKKPVPSPEFKPEMGDDTIVISDEEVISNDEMIIVMSDASDVTYEIEMDEALEASNVEWAIDKIVLEEQLFTRSSSDASNAEYAHVSSHVNWRLSENWDMQLAARIDAYDQHGKHGTDVNDVDLDYEDTYIRYRDDRMRVTVGAQTIRWGRVDILAPTDNMVTLDLSRGILPNWDDLYRASLALRGELFAGKSKLDFVYLPKFREAELAADKDNVWYPINRRKGEILGAKSNPISTVITQNATIDDHYDGGDGGFGFRFSSNLNSIDYALSLQRVRLSAPSYKMNEQFRQSLLVDPLSAINNQSSYGDTYTEEHPRNWIVGGDMAFQWKQLTFRFEGAWFSDMPATTDFLEYETYDGFRWATGVEFYPGDADTRVIVQLSGNHIDEQEDIVDRDNSVTLNGESETLFSNNRWRFSTKFSVGLDIKDIYISPEISYLGWEPFEVYSAVHYLDGNEQSLGGFYQENSMITIGWRGRF